MTIRKRDLDMSTFGFHAFSEIFMLWALTDFSAHVLYSSAQLSVCVEARLMVKILDRDCVNPLGEDFGAATSE